MGDESQCDSRSCLPENMPPQIKDGIDHETGLGYGCSEVYAACGVRGVQIESEPWETQDAEDYSQSRLEAFA